MFFYYILVKIFTKVNSKRLYYAIILVQYDSDGGVQVEFYVKNFEIFERMQI